jgi:hypothetical protein
MNKHSLLVLLPVLALGACAQPQSAAEPSRAADMAAPQAEAPVSHTVVLAIKGAT